MGLSYIKTKAATQEYRDNWERIFREEGPIDLTGLVDLPKEKAPTPEESRPDGNCPDCDSVHHRGCRS